MAEIPTTFFCNSVCGTLPVCILSGTAGFVEYLASWIRPTVFNLSLRESNSRFLSSRNTGSLVFNVRSTAARNRVSSSESGDPELNFRRASTTSSARFMSLVSGMLFEVVAGLPSKEGWSMLSVSISALRSVQMC